ncbi:hypothetical protein EMIHUDRAFT_352578 [Emiliania huxleyi CCMP1516]|uniref:Uncharacterized protein n=2 Tax=Emiliania huxleyi TaxID=2903 RepID=A0A0D3J0D3_EMIH1|nr:hypothetical protein EMIHUDRAFT_370171 [Emiliania huxleyi CCMP1516]XP_005784478.1 hypothetical protein EMIHUDRAFT_352578 [Emiliania huxleyi CCMP1516]EOD16968.1 hypothetical protein EMIHUDRAFT_370171 [Emiliania huxleyi CCMP1516]EOD32049.1 hypothetical protein EMIHUDRAFT_352578 [Emiliania huxleyi CCMP1516]|eukprot:XP_005769397.1 hypothetical protein EMIHUDRAFT_370171 [Emiliania huxleyi CCMP1516]
MASTEARLAAANVELSRLRAGREARASCAEAEIAAAQARLEAAALRERLCAAVDRATLTREVRALDEQHAAAGGGPPAGAPPVQRGVVSLGEFAAAEAQSALESQRRLARLERLEEVAEAAAKRFAALARVKGRRIEAPRVAPARAVS